MNNSEKSEFIKNIDEEFDRLLKEAKEKQKKLEVNDYIENGDEQLEIETEDVKISLNNEKIDNLVNASREVEQILNGKKQGSFDSVDVDELIKKIDEKEDEITDKLENDSDELEIETEDVKISLTDEKIDNLIKASKEVEQILNGKKQGSFDSVDVDELIKKIDEKVDELESQETSEGNICDKIKEIKNKLRKKTIVFETGGIRPTNELYESWIGKVGWKLENETQPIDENNNYMQPLLTLFLENLEYVPDALKKVKLITVFMSNDIWKNLSSFDYKNWFVIRCYEDLDNIVPCNYVSDIIKAFPLVPSLKINDFPMYEDLEDEMIDFISELEEKENIDYYNDIVEENYPMHKLGGYPASIQGGVGYDDGFEFVFQISSDSKAMLNIVDSGNFYFGYNPTLKEWSVRCDFY